MDNENTQNKKPVMTLLFRKANDGLVSITLTDKQLEKCQQFLGIRTREWLEPVVAYNWDTRQLLKNKLKTILDAVIVNNTQKDAVFTLIEKAVDETEYNRVRDCDSDMRCAKHNAQEVEALDGASLSIATPPYPCASEV